MSETTHRAGFVITAKDELGKVLGNYGRQLLTLHQRLEMVKKDFAAVDAGALKGLGKQAEKMAMYVGSAQKAVSLGAENAKIANMAAETEGRKLLLAEKLRGEEGKTLLLSQRRDNEETFHLNKVSEMRERMAQAQRRSDDAASIAAEHLQSAKLRVLNLEERRAKVTERLTSDEQKMLSIQERIAKIMPGKGNYFAVGQQMLSGSMGVLGGIASIGHNKAVQDLQHEQLAIGGYGLSKRDTSTLYAGARVTQRIHGMDQATSLEVAKDAYNVLRDAKEASDPRIAGTLAKMMVKDKSVYHLNGNQIQQAMQSADMLLQDTPEMKKMNPKSNEYQEARLVQLKGHLDTVQKMIEGTGGRIKPNEIRNQIAGMRSARFGVTDQGLMDDSGLIAEQRGARSGNMASSFATNFLNFQTPAYIIEHMLKAGLLDPKSKIVRNRKGNIDKNRSVFIAKDADLLVKSQKQWFDKDILPLADRLKNNAEKKRFLDGLAGSRVVRDKTESLYFQHQMLTREAQGVNKAHNVAQGYAAVQGSYGMAEARLTAARNSLIQAASPAAMEAAAKGMNMLAGGIERLADTISAHPKLAKAGVYGTGAGAATVGVGALGLMGKGVWDGLKFLGGGAKGLGKLSGLTSKIKGAGMMGDVEGGAALGVRLGGLVAPMAEAGIGLAEALSGPIGWTIAAVTTAVAVGVTAWKTNFMGFRSVTAAIGSFIHTNWMKMVHAMGAGWKWMTDGLQSQWKRFSAYVSAMWKGSPMEKLANMVGGAANWAKNGLAGFNKAAQDWAAKQAAEQAKAEKEESAKDGGKPPVVQHFYGDHLHQYPKGTDGHTAHKTTRRMLQSTGKTRHPMTAHGGT